ncbi:MAG: aminomethyl-transferring glycine dehydrogenase [Flavobacteriaceae bacterium]
MKPYSFVDRHVGPRAEQLDELLQTVGATSVEQLIQETIPADIRLKKPLILPEPLSEYEYLNHIEGLSQKNKRFKNYIGLGYHPTITPSPIKRNIFENPGWYTAYTPYQAEIAQGRLEALLNYQTMVTSLTNMEIANASLLDEGTAAAEAMTMLFGLRDKALKTRNAVKFFVDQQVLPQTLSVLTTRATPIGIILEVGPIDSFSYADDYFGALLQYPGQEGIAIDGKPWAERCQAHGIMTVVAADLMALTLLTPPGNWGVDAVVGTSQRFGVPMGYGGPHAAFLATKEAYKRNIPGRIIGVTKDADGNRALRMALQTREQHIKRDKATSNICTAQVLLSVMAGMYGVYHGPSGLKAIAGQIHHKAQVLAESAAKAGIKVKHKAYFDTIWLEVPEHKVRPIAEQSGVNFYYTQQGVGIAVNETTSDSDVEEILAILGKALDVSIARTEPNRAAIDGAIRRTSEFMQEQVFNSYHSETELMRYIKRLESKDLALNTSMISLGSCTMKLNAATEMIPLGWTLWADMHPFAPLDQVQGYQEMLELLRGYLTEITGFADTSLQPNSGAQGEYAGLMVIRAYHASSGDHHRNICLIPASAHGTNPASAVMAGMQVVVTKTDERGNIDLADLEEKALAHKDQLAALMVTYPSTHGVFESSIRKITELIHACGGQVYMDGANMNAQVGLTNPATIGADVCHLNLHKTFAIPHGGGGPGVGPICVAPQLAPFLPSNPVIPTGGSQATTAISAAPWGSALACLISYGYIRMLGFEGLKKSTEYAILNANYIKARLEAHYPILYTGELGRAAHEMILDCRSFKAHGIEVTDIAKRLMDYGFHAPTVSFPVGGTMMVEPTESESKEELDRFCDAMISIRHEIEEAKADVPNNPLKNAPHTMQMVTGDDWSFPYSRQKAAFPLSYVSEHKFWPSVRRVDDAYGDRNLICTCAPIESYVEA